MYDVIIIGRGPAGISASLYTKRANLKTLVIGKDGGALAKAQKIENYYGIVGNGEDILAFGEKQAKDLEVEIIAEEVLNISYDSNFIITTTNKKETKKYEAKAVILATGVNRPLPYIKGIKEFENKGISYCAICDGFFYKGKNVAVLGNGQYALHEARYLQNIAKTVTILTNGKTIEFDEIPKVNEAKATQINSTDNLKAYETEDFHIYEAEIDEVIGDSLIKAVRLKDGTEIQIDGLFIANGIASSVDLAKKIGAKTENNKIIVNENMQTTVKGLYAAGDCTGGLLQISKAVYEGAKSATDIIKLH